MGLFRLLILIALVLAVVWLWRRFTRPRPAAGQTEQTTLPMVRCTHCGIHVPQARALSSGEHWYCSQAHLQQDKASGDH